MSIPIKNALRRWSFYLGTSMVLQPQPPMSTITIDMWADHIGRHKYGCDIQWRPRGVWEMIHTKRDRRSCVKNENEELERDLTIWHGMLAPRSRCIVSLRVTDADSFCCLLCFVLYRLTRISQLAYLPDMTKGAILQNLQFSLFFGPLAQYLAHFSHGVFLLWSYCYPRLHHSFS